MVQLNCGIEPSARTLRGMHYQLSPHAEANYIIVRRSQRFRSWPNFQSAAPCLSVRPVTMEEAHKIFPDRGVTCYDNLPMALAQTDAVAVVTPLGGIQPSAAYLRMQKPQPIVVDGAAPLPRRAYPDTRGSDCRPLHVFH
jgi:hypothetical protein